MKKAFFALCIAGGLMTGLTSCTKDYTCSCTYNYITNQDTTINYLYEGVKKADAEEASDLSETTYKLVDANATCTLN